MTCATLHICFLLNASLWRSGVWKCVFFSQRATLTSVSVVKVDEPLPLVMVQQTENSSPQTGPHLDDKLHVSVDGEAGRNEGGVQRPAEGGQRVHGLPVIEAEDGINSSGELGADWWERQGTGSDQRQAKQSHWWSALPSATDFQTRFRLKTKP